MRVFAAHIILLSFIAACSVNDSSEKTRSLPEDTKIITSDIGLFWDVYNTENPLFSPETFEKSYFKNGTKALRLFYDAKVKDASKLTNVLNNNAYRNYYESIRENTLNIDSRVPELKVHFQEMEDLYQPSVFTDVVFVIGAFSTGGTVVKNNDMVIGVEFFTKSDSSQIDKLGQFQQANIRNAEFLSSIVVHELTHVQQLHYAGQNQRDYLGNGTLLDAALAEGIADFISFLITEKRFNYHLAEYADPIEEELWNEFRQEMNGSDLSGWLFIGSNSGDRPGDLGYYIGFKIAEYFYEKSPDKKEAVRNMIELEDGQAFLVASGYEDKFNS